MITNVLRKITKTYILKYKTCLIFCLKKLITIFLKSKKHFLKIFILFKIKKKFTIITQRKNNISQTS